MQTLSAPVRKIDINPYVQVPEGVLRKLQEDANREKGPIPVKGTLQGKSFSATVVRFRGMWRLYLNTDMRRAAGVEVGDNATIRLHFDNAPRTVPAPRRFTQALSKNNRAREAFQKLTPSRQKEILRYLNSLKRPESLERNIEKIVHFLQGEKVPGLVTVTREKHYD